jgi:molybdopterin molybdotransferase
MIEFDEAYKIVMESVFETESETISFRDSCDRILDEDIYSDIDMPPFNRSAVDGYACNYSWIKNDLEVVEVIAAGKKPVHVVDNNQCSKIMTGAIVPDGCDVVFMVEESVNLPGGKIRFNGTDSKRNISFKGEDVKTGDKVLSKKGPVKPQHIAVMASVGHTKVLVKKKPVIGIISTGDELVDPSVNPGISQIRNSNASQLNAQIKRAGGIGIDYGIATDNEAETYEIVVRAIDECDIVIITGGVSMGDFDFVPSVLEKSGVRILFDRVNVQPGKPITFGVHSKAVVFGLPGNPVSSFIQFEMLVRPFINRMTGYNWIPSRQNFPMAVDFERKSSARLGLIPVMVNESMEVIPVDFHGSAHIAALTDAAGIVFVKPGVISLKKGDIVNVRQI